MNKTLRSIILWLFAFLFMAAIAIYQRMTGPTFPTRGKVELAKQEIKFALLTSQENDKDAEIRINAPDEGITGYFHFKRFKSHDEWSKVPMQRDGEYLLAYIPKQPAAGKVMYKVELGKGSESLFLTEEPVIIRFKGPVPAFVLWPHIIFMFLAMVLSTRTGLEALAKGKNTYLYAWATMILLLIGGLILGPIIQKYAFDAYWTGWPFGHDLTDNKTIVSFLFWVVALLVLRKNRENRLWPVIAALILLAIYLIPHSVLGSELDYTAMQTPGK